MTGPFRKKSVLLLVLPEMNLIVLGPLELVLLFVASPWVTV
jgi:hypothetical protein